MIELDPTIYPCAREWRNHPEVMAWCRQHTLISEEDHAAWLSRIHSDPTIKMFSILDRKENPLLRDGEVLCEIVGVCGLTSIDQRNQRAEFSLYIDPKLRRKGYAKQALMVLLKHGFDDWNLNCIWGETFEGNPAIALFKDLGMTYEGTLRQRYWKGGKFIDTHVVSFLREEFYARYRDRPSDGKQPAGTGGERVPSGGPSNDAGASERNLRAAGSGHFNWLGRTFSDGSGIQASAFNTIPKTTGSAPHGS